MITFKELEEQLDEAHKVGDKVLIHKGPADVKGKEGHISEIRKGLYKGAPKTYTIDYDHHETTGARKSVQLKPTHFKAVKEDLDEARMTAAMKLQKAFEREQEQRARERKAGEDLTNKNKEKPVKEDYHNNRTGFAKRRREDDEYHVPDPVGRTHKIVHTVSKEGGEKHSRTVTISNSTKTHDEAKKLARAHLEKQGYTIHEAAKPTSQVEKARKLGQFHKKTGFTGRNPFKDHPSDVQQAYANAKKQTNEEVEHVTEASIPKGHTIEAHGIKGMKGTPWRKTFKHHDHLHDWADKNDSVEIHGTRELEGTKKAVKEDVQLDETSIKKYKHLGATKQTTHFVKNTTTGEVLSPHRGRADAEEGLRAAEADGAHGHKFKIVRAVKEGTLAEGAYEDAEENKKSADSAKKQGDMFAHHLHMADHHDNLSQWHASKGRHGEADRHAEKAEQHHEEAMKHKNVKESSEEVCRVCNKNPCWCDDSHGFIEEGLKPNHNMRPGWMLKADPELAAKVKKNQQIAKARKASYGNPDAGKSVKEDAAVNNVGGGAIAGTQGDAGKKVVMTKTPLKRNKLPSFKEIMDKP